MPIRLLITLLFCIFAHPVYAAEQSAAAGARTESDDPPHLRMASWDIGPIARSAPRDAASIASVVKNFDLVIFQSATNPADLDIALTILKSITSQEWSLEVIPSNTTSLGMLWRSDRIQAGNYKKTIPSTNPTSPTVAVRTMSFGKRPFVLVAAQLHNTSVDALRTAVVDLTQISSLLSNSNRSTPIFLAANFSAATGNPIYDPLKTVLKPLDVQGPTRISAQLEALDTIWTNFPRPVRAGVYPYERSLSLPAPQAKDKISHSRPIFVLTNLEL